MILVYVDGYISVAAGPQHQTTLLKNGDWLHRPKPVTAASTPQPLKARGRCCLSPFFNKLPGPKADARVDVTEPRPEEAVLRSGRSAEPVLTQTLISQIVISNLARLNTRKSPN